MNKEPVLISGAFMVLVTSIVTALVAFGIDWSEAQQTAILGVASAFITFIALAIPFIRSFVTPTDKAKALVTEALTTDPVGDPVKAQALQNLDASVVDPAAKVPPPAKA